MNHNEAKNPQKPSLYFIPGLAATPAIFRNIKLDDYDCHYFEWEDPKPGDTISTYAKRFADRIEPDKPFVLVGCSLGGIMSSEVAKHVKPERIILISSITNRSQFPNRLKVFRILQLHHVIPYSVIVSALGKIRMMKGGGNKEEAQLVYEMAKASSAKFFRWACNEILFWKHVDSHPNTYHIHGNKDTLFPIRRVKPHYAIDGGSHFMVVNEGKKIEMAIREILST
jgi:pimeloyl-ACP methyl ester carboxylesterase